MPVRVAVRLAGGEGGLITFLHIRPHAELHEDVRGHVQRVRRRRRDLRVPACRFQRQDGVLRRVAGVDQVVRRAGMVGIALEDVHGDGRRFHRALDVLAVLRLGVEREGVEKRNFIVLGKLAVEPGEALHPGRAAILKQCTSRLDQALLRQRELRVSRNPGQRGATRTRFLLVPDGVIVGHRLAPERDRAGRGFLRRDERIAGVVVHERMQVEHPLQHVLLAGPGPGGREVRDAQVRRQEERKHGHRHTA